ncbi:MAG: NAD-dependent epimerase/dehydratase family protein [Bacteroidales bacterium]|jgi:nucleoside-diphosphate-sugar epimerase|nr:NAD-dependent epimerase/dehydratase family protein [Bacteroidales bacterium]
MEKILIIGCSGQIGTELTLELRKIYGDANVFATDIKEAPPEVRDSGPFEILDVLDEKRLNHFAIRHKITQVYNLAAVLSGNAEKIPMQAWNINMIALLNILELGRSIRLNKVFWPSSIAVFGPTTPKINTPQLTITEPNTVYGISKLAGERWGEYYHKRYCIDFRSVRYPGLISYKTEPGGGTTDYAVEIYYKAIEEGKYECFLKEDTGLPMMFMPDAIKATISLMETEAHKITVRSSYNIGGMSFTPYDVAQSIIKHIPDFEVAYKPDFRQAIANSWPTSIDDEVARNDWGLTYDYDLGSMTEVMLREIRAKMNS